MVKSRAFRWYTDDNDDRGDTADKLRNNEKTSTTGFTNHSQVLRPRTKCLF
jgi:hypothetical protein